MMAYIKGVASVVLRHTVNQSGLSTQNPCQMNLQTRLTQLLSDCYRPPDCCCAGVQQRLMERACMLSNCCLSAVLICTCPDQHQSAAEEVVLSLLTWRPPTDDWRFKCQHAEWCAASLSYHPVSFQQFLALKLVADHSNIKAGTTPA